MATKLHVEGYVQDCMYAIYSPRYFQEQQTVTIKIRVVYVRGVCELCIIKWCELCMVGQRLVLCAEGVLQRLP